MSAIMQHITRQPDWLLAVVIIVIGWLAGFLVRVVATRVLTLIRFDAMFARTGAGEFLKKGGVTQAPSSLVGRGLYWIVLMAAFIEASRRLDIEVATEFRQRFVAALPSVLSAILVLAVGVILVSFCAAFVRTVTLNAGSPYSTLWSRITRWLGILLVLGVALEQANLSGAVLAGVIQIVLAAIAFGVALAFGLGCKDMARHATEKFIEELKERHRNVPKSDLEG